MKADRRFFIVHFRDGNKRKAFPAKDDPFGFDEIVDITSERTVATLAPDSKGWERYGLTSPSIGVSRKPESKN